MVSNEERIKNLKLYLDPANRDLYNEDDDSVFENDTENEDEYADEDEFLEDEDENI